jgi:hypothetical protein
MSSLALASLLNRDVLVLRNLIIVGRFDDLRRLRGWYAAAY